MAGQMMRVVLKPAGVDEDEGNARQLIVDLVLDSETGASSGPFPAFGRIGDFRKNETLVPFTLMMDGRLDLGAHASDAARQDKLAIRSAKLATGESVALTGADGDTSYLVVSVTPLIAG